MTNSTAAGPSRGLLDILFGSKGTEEAETDGQGFMGLMNFIKNMNGQKEEPEAEIGRTQRETTPGKDGVEYAVLAMPWMNTPFASAQLQPDQVNQLLKQKALPPLSTEETKLLNEVNSKMAAVNAGQQQAELPPALAVLLGPPAANSEQAAEKAAHPAATASEAAFLKEMAQKGVDARKIKSGEVTSATASAAPEKILSTEAYLQMQGINKPGAKDIAAKNQAANINGQGREISGAQARGQESLTQGAVSGAEQKGTVLNAHKGREALDLPEAGAKPGPAPDGLFAATLMQGLKPNESPSSRDVYLPSGKPEEMRAALLAEVGTGVSLQAHKGGGEMRLVIHPDDLGEVKLKIGTKNGKVEVQVVAQNDDVAKLIRGGSKELESALRDQNLSLTKFEVTVGDAAPVVATDTRSNLSDQFFSQNQQYGGLSQGSTGDDGRNARWGGEQGGRQGSGFGSSASEEQGRAASSRVRSVPKQATRDQSRRLDVVA